jgi:hypothetical protein
VTEIRRLSRERGREGEREREIKETTDFKNGVNHVAFGDALTP